MTLHRDADAAIAWATGQIAHPDRNYRGLCQSFCRTAYGVPAWADSAQHAWDRIPHDKRHPAASPSAAPRGALLYYAGGKYGHVALAIGRKTHDKCLSNDYIRAGRIDIAPRDFHRWGMHFLGWSFWTPYGELRRGGR